MQDDDTPRAAGGARVPARHTQAPIGRGWDPMERSDWEAVAATLPTPWPPGAQRHDLRYWASLERLRAGNRPSYRQLAARWGVSDRAAREACADVLWWADPRFGDEHPERTQSGTKAEQKRNTGGANAEQERNKSGTAAPHNDGVFGDKRSQERNKSGANAEQERNTGGAKPAPIDDRDSDRDTNSHTDRESMSGAAAPTPAGAGPLSLIGGGMEPVKPAKPTKAVREADEAARTFARLEALRLTRHSGGRGLSSARWVPEVRRALAKSDAQDLVDALVWVLHDPAAAFHRGEDQRSPGPDRTTDLALVLRHPEYALRRSWWGTQAPSAEELAEEEEARAEGRPAPAWVERRAASPMGRRAAQDAERKRREDDEARAWLRANAGASGVMDDDDVCF